jgi:hypothetical protein
MGSLFRGWPKDRIAQIYLDDSEPDQAVCSNSRHLEIEDLRMPRWLRRRIAQRRQPGVTRRSATETPASNNGDRRLRRTVEDTLKKTFLSYARWASYPVSADLDGWIKAFRPDLIYSTLEHPHVISLVKDISRKYGVSVVPHFMDDWIAGNLPHSDGVLDHYVWRRAKRQAFGLMRTARARLAIGEQMAVEYKRRYGYEFYPFMNCVDLDARPVVERELEVRSVFRFGCVGALHSTRPISLRQVANALMDASKEGIVAEIVIYQNPSGKGVPDDLLSGSLVRLSSSEEDALLGTAAADLDAFLHLDTFDPDHVPYFRYSLSAKIPWYLASGIPVFAYGPRDIASIRYLEEQCCALIVDHQSSEILGQEMRRFITDKDLRTQLGERARSVAVMYHDAHIVRERFRRVLASAVGASQQEN